MQGDRRQHPPEQPEQVRRRRLAVLWADVGELLGDLLGEQPAALAQEVQRPGVPLRRIDHPRFAQEVLDELEQRRLVLELGAGHRASPVAASRRRAAATSSSPWPVSGLTPPVPSGRALPTSASRIWRRVGRLPARLAAAIRRPAAAATNGAANDVPLAAL